MFLHHMMVNLIILNLVRLAFIRILAPVKHIPVKTGFLFLTFHLAACGYPPPPCPPELSVDTVSVAASADAGREAITKVAAPALSRKRRRDNRVRNGSSLSTTVLTIKCQTLVDLVRPTVGTIKFPFRNINSILCG